MKKIISMMIALMMALCSNAAATLENYIYADDTTMGNDGAVVLSVKMRNDVAMTGFQFDMELPEGVTVEMEDEFMLIDLSTARTTTRKTDYFNSAKQPDGTIRVMCSSTKSYTFTGSDGEVATISLKGSSTSSGVIKFKNIVLSDANGKTYKTLETACNLLGSSPALKCSAPKVSLVNGKLTFTSDTEGAVYHYSVTPKKIAIEGTTTTSVDISDNTTFEISVYATSVGYAQSDVVNETITITVADVNGDGKVTIADANAIVNTYLGK